MSKIIRPDKGKLRCRAQKFKLQGLVRHGSAEAAGVATHPSCRLGRPAFTQRCFNASSAAASVNVL